MIFIPIPLHSLNFPIFFPSINKFYSFVNIKMLKDDALGNDQNQFIYLAWSVTFPQPVLALKENSFTEVEISS